MALPRKEPVPVCKKAVHPKPVAGENSGLARRTSSRSKLACIPRAGIIMRMEGKARDNHSSPRRNSGAGRHAVGVDAPAKVKNLRRLKRIEGQVRGVERMVEEERYCADIMVQIAAINEALRAVGRELLHNHLRQCATEAIRSGSSRRAEEMYAELSDLFAKFAR